MDEEEDAEEVHTLRYAFPNPIQDRISNPATSKEVKQWNLEVKMLSMNTRYDVCNYYALYGLLRTLLLRHP